jgi:hypothetical protein
MTGFLKLLNVGVLAAGFVSGVCAESIQTAAYRNPTERYGHFALGRPHEYAALVVQTDTGQRHTWALAEGEVFEDLTPRLVRFSAGGPVEVLTIVSSRSAGSRLVVLGLANDRLRLLSQSQPIGTPMRWLNPVGVADLDGDGVSEVAAVVTPHIGGLLTVYQKRGDDLVALAKLPGFSNHRNGSSELAMSAALNWGGAMRLLVPDTERRVLRVIALRDGALTEQGRCALRDPMIGAMRVRGDHVLVQTGAGVQSVAPKDCSTP